MNNRQRFALGIMMAFSSTAAFGAEPANISLCVNVSEQVKPDEFVLNWTYQRTDKSAATAMARVNALSTDGLEALKRLGVEEERVSASNIQLSSETDYDEHGREIQIGHRAAREFKVRFGSLESAGVMIANLPEGDEISIENLQPTVSDRADQKRRLREISARQLEHEANQAAALFGQRVVGLQDLSDRPTNRTGDSTLEMITVTGDALGHSEPTLAGQVLKEGTIEISQRLCGTFLITSERGD